MDDPTPSTTKQPVDDSTSQPSATDLLRESLGRLGYQQLSDIQCSTSGDEIVLSGQLDSFYLKQVAQSVAINIPGINRVKNEIQVV